MCLPASFSPLACLQNINSRVGEGQSIANFPTYSGGNSRHINIWTGCAAAG